MNDFLDFVGIIFVVMVATVIVGAVIATPFVGAAYYSSCREARIYNAQHNTDWTCSDFFWAGEQINDKTQTVRIR